MAIYTYGHIGHIFGSKIVVLVCIYIMVQYPGKIDTRKGWEGNIWLCNFQKPIAQYFKNELRNYSIIQLNPYLDSILF